MKDQYYIPERGDVVRLNFNPQIGHEQSGMRPAIVISPQSYNSKIGLALFQPITKVKKGYPFEVNLPSGLPISGVILSDQIKSLDWKSRNIKFICKVELDVLFDAIDKLSALIDSV